VLLASYFRLSSISKKRFVYYRRAVLFSSFIRFLIHTVVNSKANFAPVISSGGGRFTARRIHTVPVLSFYSKSKKFIFVYASVVVNYYSSSAVGIARVFVSKNSTKIYIFEP